jgi:hypothetical protein
MNCLIFELNIQFFNRMYHRDSDKMVFIDRRINTACGQEGIPSDTKAGRSNTASAS